MSTSIPVASEALSTRAAYAFGAARELAKEVNAIKAMPIEWERSYDSTVRRGYLVALFKQKGVFEDFKKQHWPNGNSPQGETLTARYLRIKQAYEDYLAGKLPEPKPAAEEDVDEVNDLAFALEFQLRDFIASNLSKIGIPGKQLKLYIDSSDRNGIEYPTAVGPIDILAVDATGSFYVFELKRASSPDRAIGQVARYMGWVKENLANGTQVHGVIVAKEIGDKLRYAIQVVPNVSLFQYEIEFRLASAHRFVA